MSVSSPDRSRGDDTRVRLPAEPPHLQRAAPPPAGPDATFRQVAEALPQLVWSAPPDGTPDWFNERWHAYTGLPRRPSDDQRPRAWDDCVHPDDRPEAERRWRTAVETGGDYEVEYRLREGAGGRYRWFLVRAVALRDGEGRVVRWLGSCTDIDATKRAERFARAQGGELRAQRDAVAQQNEMLQQQAVELEMQAAQLQEQALELEVSQERLQAQTRALEAANDELHRVNEVLLAGRRAIEAAGVHADRARVDAEHARAVAEEANRAKAEFLANMSHELRTPLNAIGGYTELLTLGIHGPLTDAQREALGRVQRSQQHLLRLITDILNFARLEAGRVEYRLSAVPIAEVVTEVAMLIEPLVGAKGVAFTVEPPDDGAAGGSGAHVARADREKLSQVLLNLLSNAVKFTPAGGRIGVRWGDAAAGDTAAGDAGVGDAAVGGAASPDASRAERLAVTVYDTGRGIPGDRLASVFEPFVQVDAGRTRTSEGAGLGLAISRDLARGMGGELTATSVPGLGSAFTVTLPRVG